MVGPPTLKIFQPPWTDFGRADDMSSDALPAVGPGDRFLAATRALQQLHLDDDRGGAGDDVKMEPSGELPWPVPMATSVVGLPQFSVAQEPRHDVVATGALGNCGNPKQVDRQVEPSSGVQHSSSMVTVMINGVPRKGAFNSAGEVVIQSESPKYFALGDQARPEREVETQGSENPFAAQAASPFRVTSQSRNRSPSIPPPPPPPPASSRGARTESKSPSGYRSMFPRRPSRSPNPSPPRAPAQAACQVNASPATPGGTRVPKMPPPVSPPVPEVRSAACEGLQSLEEGDARDFRPGERTLWELPVLAPVGEANPAMRFSDIGFIG